MAENEEVQNDPVVNYEQPKKPYKVAFTGDYNVGKTSLFRAMFKQKFSDEKPPSSEDKGTHMAVFHEHKIVIPLEIWDTADMERHDSITRHYYRGSHLVLLVYSAVDEHSLHRLSKIADNVKLYEPSAKLILVRNKIDLPIEEVQEDGVPEERENFSS